MKQPTADDARSRISELLGQRPTWYGGAIVTTVAERDEDTWLNLLTVTEWVKDANSIAPITHAYPAIRIVRQSVTVPQSQEGLARLTTDRHLGLQLGDMHVRFAESLAAMTPVSRLRSEWCKWPADVFHFVPAVPPALPRIGYQPLVAIGSPLFPTLGEALFDLFGIGTQSWSQYFRGDLVFIVPDLRARITALAVSEKRLVVTIEALEASLGDLIVKLFTKAEATQTVEESVAQSSAVEFDLADGSAHVYVALLCRRSGDLLDYATLNAEPKVGRESQAFDDLELGRLVANGEDLTTEYKRWKPTPERLAKDAVAFANTIGGVILLGVDDEGDVLGQPVHAQADWVAGVLADQSDPPVKCRLHKVLIREKQVLLIDIPKAEQVHTLKGRGPIIRFNATSRSPSRNELDSLYNVAAASELSYR